IILSPWYLNTNIQLDDLLQKYPSIPFDSLGSQSSQKLIKTIYAELFGLSKKVINYFYL
ncbi:1980_t:CDS:2, partial [Funneliformis mosseae]